MLIVLSPAKTINFSRKLPLEEYTVPVFIDQASELVKILKNHKPGELSSLMGISARLADLNYERFIKWNKLHKPDNARHAIGAYDGDVYDGLEVDTLSTDNLKFINKNVRIFSGLYGILKPFDLIMEYRLEMGTRLTNDRGSNLYQFWDKKINQQINKAIEESDGEKVLINLASAEYFKSIISASLKYPVITPVFKEYKDGAYKFIGFLAKKARGMMTRFAAIEKITKPEELKSFTLGGYAFDPEMSSKDQWVFTR